MEMLKAAKAKMTKPTCALALLLAPDVDVTVRARGARDTGENMEVPFDKGLLRVAHGTV